MVSDLFIAHGISIVQYLLITTTFTDIFWPSDSQSATQTFDNFESIGWELVIKEIFRVTLVLLNQTPQKWTRNLWFNKPSR